MADLILVHAVFNERWQQPNRIELYITQKHDQEMFWLIYKQTN